MSTNAMIAEIIRNGEKAKLAILRELTFGDSDWFELSEAVRKKYYKENFVALPFITKLETDGLIKKEGQKFRLLNKESVTDIFSTNKNEIDRILSLEYGKGDLTGQLYEQEKYILLKVLYLGNSVPVEELHEDFSSDIEHHLGPFSGYSKPSYARQRSQVITKELVRKGFLKVHEGSISVPERVLSDFLVENLSTILLSMKRIRDENRQLAEENSRFARKIHQLDPSIALESVKVPGRVNDYIVKAISRIEEKSYSEAILNCYRVSEYLAKSLFDFLYPTQAAKRKKHEHKLRVIWNDNVEENLYPGIKAIASLLSVILWYRNKMSAHTEMEPTEDAARICVFSTIQSLKEFNRLSIPIKEQ